MGVGEAISPSLTDLTIPDGEGKTSSEVRRTERVGEKDHRLFSRKVALGFRGGKMEDGRNRGRPAPETPAPSLGAGGEGGEAAAAAEVQSGWLWALD